MAIAQVPSPPQATFDVVNPITGSQLASLSIQTKVEVKQAVAQARQAQQKWEELDIQTRIKLLRAWGELRCGNNEKTSLRLSVLKLVNPRRAH